MLNTNGTFQKGLQTQGQCLHMNWVIDHLSYQGMQLKFKMRYYFIPTWRAKVKREKMVSKGEEEQKLFCIAGRNVK